ncbi:phosphoglycerate mutase, partial [Myxococcota bacterium]|nr:phosphoglycerate mutase [Myxococcota bacterium]
NERLGSDRVHFHTGTHYRHLLVIDGGKAAINCWPPHDHLETPVDQLPVTATAPEGEETAAMLNQLVEASRSILAEIPWVKEKAARHERRPTSIWPWAAGEKPHMIPIKELTGLSGATITAVDLIKGLGIYAGMTPIHVEGATGNWQTNYEGKAAAAIEALKTYDYIYLHVEAADEAGHDGDMKLKMSVIEDLDSRLIAPIMKHIDETGLDIRIALLPDHPTPVETRLHTKDPVPVAIWGSGITADDVTTFDEESVKSGRLGLLDQKAFFHHFFQ